MSSSLSISESIIAAALATIMVGQVQGVQNPRNQQALNDTMDESNVALALLAEHIGNSVSLTLAASWAEST